MPIDITIIKSPGNVSNDRSSQTFSEVGGTIGRGSNNSWVLDDPEKFMSSTHMGIGFENGQYTLTDMSTNGTFVNGASEPLGNGNKITLHEGDRFVISDYEFLVTIREIDQSDNGLFNSPVDDGPFGSAYHPPGEESSFGNADPFALPVGVIDAAEPLFGVGEVETDPLAALDKANSVSSSPFQSEIFPANSFSDQSTGLTDSVAWPNPVVETGAIPEDWEEESVVAAPLLPQTNDRFDQERNDIAYAKLENDYLTLENENKSLMLEIAKLKHFLKEKNATAAASSQKINRTFTAHDKTLIEAMGLAKHKLSKEKMTEISHISGLLLRETMEGLMRVLSFKKKIKEEFRINVTTIQPVENNPLKFSANLEDALENMFIRENNAYKKPVEAVQEGFQGIAEHQVAVLAGMQAAFKGMIERFDPEALEKRFEKYNKSGVIQFGQKGKNWQSYKAFHADLMNDIDNSFQHLFGYDFVQAYEEQMQRLAIARKSNNNKKSNTH